MKRTPLLRRLPMSRGGAQLRRTAMSVGPSASQRRMIALRRDAYRIVDGRSGGWCEAGAGDLRCWNVAAQHHHRRPRRQGGSTDPTTETAANLVAVCASHHDGIESNRAAAYELGLLLRAGQRPTDVPAQLWCGLVRLSIDGKYLKEDSQ